MRLALIAVTLLLTAASAPAQLAAADIGMEGEWVLTGSPAVPAGTFESIFALRDAFGTLVTLHDGTARLIGKPVQQYLPDTGRWTPAGSLVGNGGVVTLLPSGTVLVTGLSAAEVYDPATGVSMLTEPMTIPRTGHQATLLSSGDVLVSGGTDLNGLFVGPAELYRPSTGTWTLTGAMNNARSGHTAILLPTGKILAAGGAGTGGRFTSAELYDAASGKWVFTNPNAVGGSVSTLLPGGQALVVGVDGSFPRPTSQLYDFSTGSWSASAVVPTGLDPGFTVSVGPATLGTMNAGRVLLVSVYSTGGQCAIPVLLAALYDSTTGAWSRASNLLEAPGRFNPSMSILPDGRALLARLDQGCFSSGVKTAAELFRPDNTTPRLAVTPANVDLGTVAIGAPAQQTITVQNTGQAHLNGSLVLSSNSSPAFQLLSGTTLSLAPGATSVSVVHFSASNIGAFTGSVAFMTNGGWQSMTLRANVGVELSGRVSDASGAGAPSVPVELHGTSSANTATDTEGRYSFFVQPGGAYTVIPAAPGLTFSPGSRTVVVDTNNVSGLDFVVTTVSPVAQFVTGLYENVLGRPPDSGGFAGWTGVLRQNCNLNGFGAVVQGFFDSEEFRASRPLTLTGLVTVLYRALLAREPEPAGLTGWIGVFRQPRFVLAAQDFIPSTEFQRILPDRTDRSAVTTVITRFYSEILGRVPRHDEVTAWVDYVVSTGDMEGTAGAFVASEEFEGQALTFGDYVEVLYRGILGREPDPEGLDGWEGVLRSHLLRVLNGAFISGEEFQRRIPQVCGG